MPKNDKIAEIINRYVRKHMLCEADYKDVFENSSVKLREVNIFQTVFRDTYMQLKNKVDLTP